MVKRLTYDAMIATMENVLNPAKANFTEDEVSAQLFLFCINCPDPAGAMNLVVTEAKPPVTAKELVDKALAQAPRNPSSLSASELPLTHPFRTMRLDD